MRLIRYDISGFGTLINKSGELNDGLNDIYEENGVGKTTFIAFLKAMFYGMDSKTKKGILDERKHYRPWNRNVSFGGSLVFEMNGRRYRVVRNFGKKDTDDLFEIYNDETGLISNDYTKDLGEEIFMVDKESFTKTAFLSQNDENTGFLSDVISSRISGMGEEDADLSKCDLAIKNLEDGKKNLAGNIRGSQKTKNNNLLLQKEAELNRLNELSLKKDPLSQNIINAKNLTEEKTAELKTLRETIAKNEKFRLLLERKKLINKQKAAKAKYEELKASFKEIPTKENMSEFNKNAHEYENKLLYMKDYRLSVDEQETYHDNNQKFEDSSKDVVRDLELLESNEKAYRKASDNLVKYASLKEKKERLNNLNNIYADKETACREIEDAKISLNRIKELEAESALLEKDMFTNDINMITPEVNNIKFAYILDGICVFLVIIGSLLLFMRYKNGADMTSALLPLPLISYVAAIVLFIASLLMKKRYKDAQKELNEKKEELKKKELKIEENTELKDALDRNIITILSKYGKNGDGKERLLYEALADIDKISDLQNEISKEEESYLKAQTEIQNITEESKQILTEYRIFSDDISEGTRKLEKLYASYKQAKDKYEKYESLSGEISELKNALEDAILRFFNEKQESYIKTYEYQARAYDEYMLAKATYESVDAELEKRRSEENVDEEKASEVSDDYEILDLDELRVKEENLNNDIGKLNSDIKLYEDELNGILAELDDEPELVRDIEKLREDNELLDKKAEIYEQAKNYLDQARTNIQTRYIDDVSHRYRHYYEPLIQNSAVRNETSVNTSLEINVSEGAVNEKMDSLSRGKQDLVKFSLRMALIDSVYRDCEKPFVVLDDPFVNFDDNTLEAAKNEIRSISEDYQVLYFTCHSSRQINN